MFAVAFFTEEIQGTSLIKAMNSPETKLIKPQNQNSIKKQTSFLHPIWATEKNHTASSDQVGNGEIYQEGRPATFTYAFFLLFLAASSKNKSQAELPGSK